MSLLPSCAQIQISPYKLAEDNHLKLATEVAIFSTLLAALMLKTLSVDEKVSRDEWLNIENYNWLLIFIYVI